MISQVGHIIGEVVGGSGLAALRQDEFIRLLGKDLAAARETAEVIGRASGPVLREDGKKLRATSIGIAVLPETARDLDALSRPPTRPSTARGGAGTA
jgi:hypothetical protein